MPEVTPSPDGFVVDASVLAKAFDVDAAEVPAMLRARQITSRSETGVGDDAGRFRLTFYHQGQALRLTVDALGNIISRSRFPVKPPPDGGT
jgi:hypothetical protein